MFDFGVAIQFIPGVMLGVEFPGGAVVLDCLIVRFVIFWE